MAGVRIPASSQSRAGIQGSDAVSHLPADFGEFAPRVDRTPALRQGIDGAVGLGVSGRGLARGDIQGGDVVARLPVDVGEPAPHIDRAPAHRQRDDVAVGPGIPGWIHRVVWQDVGILLRASPPTWLNWPPMYQPPPPSGMATLTSESATLG